MKKFKYKCLDCGYEGIDHRDGLVCPKCNGYVIPIDDAQLKKMCDGITRSGTEWIYRDK
jgi:Zn finger protein HypA/HybF involved in hydrogenase expression